MKQTILDTSFILSSIRNKIDFFEEIKLMGLQIVIPNRVINELKKLAETKNKSQSELALKIIRSQKPKIINLEGKTTDKAIINYAKKNPRIIIATLDREIKNKLENSKLIIQGKKKLEIIQ